MLILSICFFLHLNNMKIIILLPFFLISSCSFYKKEPSGLKNSSGKFIYYDFASSPGQKDTVIYRMKSDRVVLIEVPVSALIKLFFDNRESIPYEGDFSADVIYSSNNRIDYFKLKTMNKKDINIEVKAEDIN